LKYYTPAPGEWNGGSAGDYGHRKWFFQLGRVF